MGRLSGLRRMIADTARWLCPLMWRKVDHCVVTNRRDNRGTSPQRGSATSKSSSIECALLHLSDDRATGTALTTFYGLDSRKLAS
jgi:hypothetical protein